MKLIVGLGNPGDNYKDTRHNIGFRVIDYYTQEKNLSYKSKFNGLYAEDNINGEKIILLKPQTYMNLSGECVIKFVKFYNINIEDILIIYDDIDFEIGTFKIKRDGSAAGHNGIKNIITHLKTENIKRVRIGISKNKIPLEDYVLKKLSKEEKEKITNLLPTIKNIIEDFSSNNIDNLMQKYNKTK